MKIIFNIIITGFLLLLFSCGDDFLDVSPQGSAAETILIEPQGIEAVLIAAYDPLNGTGWGRAGFDWISGSVYSDDAYWGGEYLPRRVGIWDMDPTLSYTRHRWQSKYDAVSRANDVIRLLGKNQEFDDQRLKIPAARAIEIEAEAKALRAHYHHFLQRTYWQIPYIKTVEEMDGIQPEDVPNDRSRAETWADIENDLQFAIDNLPEDPPLNQVGRLTKFKAMILKAHVHMQQMELDQAKPLLDAIIASSRYRLVDNYFDNFRHDTQHNEESIFELEAAVGDGSNGNNAIWLPQLANHQSGPAALGWGQFQPTINLFNAFQTDEDGLPVLNTEDMKELKNDNFISSSDEFIPTEHTIDPRVDWTITRRGIPFYDWGIHEGRSWIREQSYGGPFMTKKTLTSAGEPRSPNGRYNGRNFRLYRYSHALLWRAEIYVEDGEYDQARQLVNKIRTRAKNDVVMGKCYTYAFDGRPVEVNWDEPAANYHVEPYPEGHYAFSTLEMARKAVRLEMRLEWATEGWRYFDLRRWGIDDEVLNAYAEHDLSTGRNRFVGFRYNPVRDRYYPIPQLQVDIQPNLKQDPNWQ